jgi:hypothetical protein
MPAYVDTSALVKRYVAEVGSTSRKLPPPPWSRRWRRQQCLRSPFPLTRQRPPFCS